MLRSALCCILLALSLSASAAPLRVLDLTGGALPLDTNRPDLAANVRLVRPAPKAPLNLAGADLLLLGSNTDPLTLGLQPGALEAFVRRGGGLFVAGLPKDLPRTRALYRLLGQAAPAEVPEADLFPDNSGDWLWVPEQTGETADHLRYIRKRIEITRPVRRAFIRCTADNLYWAYLNGEEVGYHWSWYDHELWEISGKLRPGQNVVAFKARNVDGPGGFFAQIGIEYTDGTRELIASDRSWKFHTTEQPGWTAVDFDDSAWGPATEISPMSQRAPLPDRATEHTGSVHLPHRHPVLNALGPLFGESHSGRALVPREGARVLAQVGAAPLLLARPFGQGQVLLLNTVGELGNAVAGPLADDFLAAALLWLGGRAERLQVAEAVYPPPVLIRSGGIGFGISLKGIQAPAGSVVTTSFRRDGKPVGTPRRVTLGAGAAPAAVSATLPLADYRSEGTYEVAVTARDRNGAVLFHRSTVSEVKNPINLALTIPSNRHVTAEGITLSFRGEPEGQWPAEMVVTALITDARGTRLARPAQLRSGKAYLWRYRVPHLDEGDYHLVARVTTAQGRVVDQSRLTFTVVPRLNLADFFSTTMRLSPFETLDRRAMEREIDDIIAHGFNTLTFGGRRLGAEPGSPYDYAEDYAQRRGMAISYSFQGDFSLLSRDAPPAVSVFSPEYQEALRPRIARALATCRLVPRLLNVQGYMDEPFQNSGKTFDERPPARAEFQRRYGIELPSREEAIQDPELWLKYVDFWSDHFSTGWRQSYALVKEHAPHFWVELTHDSHNTFGAAGGGFRDNWAIDDVYHWGAPFDAVNYDIYPYLSTDFRTGKFGQNRLPRLAGVHMAFAQMRNLAYSYNKKLGFWLESGWDGKLADPQLAQYHWSPRELTYTALAAGCDYLNTFWGIPEDPRWWETYRGVMREVKAIAPLLTRSRVPRAKAAFLFPRTQHVLLQEEYWNVMVALEAFRRAYGELDCLHEDQLAEGKLREYPVLVLFDVHLMKRASAETIRAWCQEGGILVADEVPSLDERKQPLGVFEALFGVTGTAEPRPGPFAVADTPHQLWGVRGYQASGATPLPTTAGGVAVAFQHRVGRGSARLLNLPLKDCYLDALVRKNEHGDADWLLGLLREALAGAPAPNVSSSNPEIEAAVRRTTDGTLLLLVINHESRNPRTRVTVSCAPAGAIARDLISGKRLSLGAGRTLDLNCPWGKTRLIGLYPANPRGLSLTGLPNSAKAGDTVKYTLKLGGRAIRGNYRVEVTVTGPDGKRREAFSGRTSTRHAECTRTVRLPINAPKGTWRVQARSLWDGARAEGRFQVR